MMLIDIATAPFPLMNRAYTRIAAEGDTNWFDGKNNLLHRYVICMPMTRWLLPYQERLSVWPGFLSALFREVNERSFHFRFFGNPTAYEVFCREMRQQWEMLEREHLEIEFSYAGRPDIRKVVSQIKELLLSLQDLQILNREDNRIANQLRNQLRNHPQITLKHEAAGSKMLQIRACAENLLEEAPMLCLALDSRDMSLLQMETEYLMQLEKHGKENAHSLRCYVLHDNIQTATQHAVRLQDSLRNKQICAWPIHGVTSEAEFMQAVEIYMQNSYEADVYLPAVVGRCVELIRPYIEQPEFELAVKYEWQLFCDLLLPQNNADEEANHAQ